MSCKGLSEYPLYFLDLYNGIQWVDTDAAVVHVGVHKDPLENGDTTDHSSSNHHVAAPKRL